MIFDSLTCRTLKIKDNKAATTAAVQGDPKNAGHSSSPANGNLKVKNILETSMIAIQCLNRFLLRQVISVKEGDRVSENDKLFTVFAMKMDMPVMARRDGVVSKIHR